MKCPTTQDHTLGQNNLDEHSSATLKVLSFLSVFLTFVLTHLCVCVCVCMCVCVCVCECRSTLFKCKCMANSQNGNYVRQQQLSHVIMVKVFQKEIWLIYSIFCRFGLSWTSADRHIPLIENWYRHLTSKYTVLWLTVLPNQQQVEWAENPETIVMCNFFQMIECELSFGSMCQP